MQTITYVWNTICQGFVVAVRSAIFTFLSSVMSALGFLFSILAFKQAKKASEAARQARDQILLKTAAEELELTCIHVEQLHDFLDHDRLSEAALRAKEAVSNLSEFFQRRTPHFDQLSRDTLQNTRTQLQIVTTTLNKSRLHGLTAKQKGQILNIVTNQAIIVLREILGKIKGEIEHGGK